MDAKNLKDFYASPLGLLVRQQLTQAIRARWTNVTGLTVIGAGYASPFLGLYRSEAELLACLMPARQGAIVWPKSGPSRAALVGEAQWPLPDNSVDRLLAIHCLEQAERVGPLLREMWRVLKPEGRALIAVPNRRGLWSRMDRTPFGYGLPFSRGQLQEQLAEVLFATTEWSEALFFPPVDRRILLRMAPAFERIGPKVSIGLAGLIIVEARKELFAPVGGSMKATASRILRPVDTLSGATRGQRLAPLRRNTAFSPKMFCAASDQLAGMRRS